MYIFTASVFVGFGCTVYGTVFGVHAMTNAFYLVWGEPYLAIALLICGILMPIVGYIGTTERT